MLLESLNSNVRLDLDLAVNNELGSTDVDVVALKHYQKAKWLVNATTGIQMLYLHHP